jgi:hypothetical protein
MKTLLILLLPVLLLAQNAENSFNKKEQVTEERKVTENEDTFPRFSFGSLYIPYTTSYIYVYNFSSYYDFYQVQHVERQFSAMEAQFSYLFTKKVGLTLEISYNSSYLKENSTEEYLAYYDTTSWSENEKNGIKKLNLIVNLKYYPFSIQTDQVSPYILLGFGKQFSQYKYSYDETDEYESSEIIDDNYEEFMSDINSPYIFKVGFGAEYFIYKSFSVFTVIRFAYQYAEGEYRYKRVLKGSEYEYVDKKNQKREQSSTTTKVGIGLNFYF